MINFSKKTIIFVGIVDLLFLMAVSMTVSAQCTGVGSTMRTCVCTWVNMVGQTIFAIGPALVLIMFTYGGVKYVFSADDPGGRKAGKMTCIHAIIGGIIISLASILVTFNLAAVSC